LLCIGNIGQLLPQRCNWILILRLLQYNSLDEFIELQRLVGDTYSRPVLVLLHFVLQDLCALSVNECIHIATMFLQSSNTLAVHLALVAILELLQICEVVEHLLALMISNVFDLILNFGNSYSILDSQRGLKLCQLCIQCCPHVHLLPPHMPLPLLVS
jgi:hypothetical protein